MPDWIDDEAYNDRAERLMGRRRTDVIPFDQPCELGYHCPVCLYEHEVNGNFDERLWWSEYEAFIWCSVCNFDYPSALCMPHRPPGTPSFIEWTPQSATEIFLDCVEQAANRAAPWPTIGNDIT